MFIDPGVRQIKRTLWYKKLKILETQIINLVVSDKNEESMNNKQWYRFWQKTIFFILFSFDPSTPSSCLNSSSGIYQQFITHKRISQQYAQTYISIWHLFCSLI